MTQLMKYQHLQLTSSQTSKWRGGTNLTITGQSMLGDFLYIKRITS